ncbi:MAG: DNA polymerase IV [Myxococcales bacterium]|nr:DNA polymerase IV [Myxococcales bacterium]
MAGERVIFHVDMDAFFASVEIRERPELRGKPVLVGGTGPRGVVAAASYEARRFGCRSAQPTAIARRRCPQAVILPPRHGLYSATSREIFAIFDRFSPLVEGLSIDEAFLDLSGAERLLGGPLEAAGALRRAVFAETRLTCSIGVATSKLVAKIASALHKPDQVTIVPAGEERAFLAPLPIGRLWGVGPKAQERLHARGIQTIGDLQGAGEATLRRWLGDHGAHLHRLALALDEREVLPDRPAKSISHEDTYEVDIAGEAAIHRELLRQATRVADRLVAAGLRGRRVQLKIRDHTFRTETRQLTLGEATAQARELFAAARKLLKSVEIEGRSFRLTGVGVGELEGAAGEQLSLLEAPKGAALQEVMSAVRKRYGHQALFPADAGAEERPGATASVHHRPRGES